MRLCLPLVLVFLLGGECRASTPQALPAAWFVRSQLWKAVPTDEPAREAEYIVRIADDRFLLELGPVRILGVRTPASLTAWHTHDPTTMFAVEGEDLAGLLRRNLPPIWSSPLARWLSQEPVPCPLVGHKWPGPVDTPQEWHGHPLRVSGSVQVAAPNEFPSLEPLNKPEYEFIWTEGDDAASLLKQIYLAVVPGEPDEWGIDIAGRTRVSSIRALAPRPPQILPGDPIRGLRLFERAGSAVELRRGFEPERTPRADRRAAAILLVLERATDQSGRDRVAAPKRAVAAARERLAVDAVGREVRRPLLLVRPVAIFAAAQYSESALAAFEARWSGLGTDALLETVEQRMPSVLWTHSPRESIDLFTPGADATAVLIDPEGRLIDALRLDPGADLEDWIVNALAPAPISVDGP